MEKISVILQPNGDYEALRTTLMSLKRQSYKFIEVIFVDNCTNDNDRLIFDKFADELSDSQISYTKKDCSIYENTAQALNNCIHTASGNLLSFVYAGTYLPKEYFVRQYKILSEYSNITDIFSYSAITYEDSNTLLPDNGWKIYMKNGRLFPYVIEKDFLDIQCMLIPKKIASAILFDEGLPALERRDFVLRLSKEFSAVFCPNTQIIIETNPFRYTDVETIIGEIFIFTKYMDEIDNLGQKENKLITILDKIKLTNKWGDFTEYLEYLCGDSFCNKIIDNYLAKVFPQRKLKISSVSDISGVENCTGCGSCRWHCPVSAISIKENDEGFYTPEVNRALCINCKKCLDACPTQIQLPEFPIPDTCFALHAKDNIRAMSSSGGIFSLAAKAILNIGGYVVGAIYDNDFTVKHIISNKDSDIAAMRTSKYVQSNLSDVLPEIKDILEKNIPVLFTGCPCQIAGLQAFLGKTYPHLYTFDFVCIGVPSPQLFNNYKTELSNKNGELAEISFRKKEKFGWPAGFYVKYKNGKEYAQRQSDPYLYLFAENVILNNCCYNCEFKSSKYSDITVGDFWGIHAFEPSFEDGLGTSYLTINTLKGSKLFKMFQSEIIKSGSYNNLDTKKYNPRIFTPVEKPDYRKYFFEAWKENKNNLSLAISEGYKKIKFDIALILLWGPNHGNAITNYALHTTLTEKLSRNYSVLVVDNAYVSPPGRFGNFAKDHYNCSSDFFSSCNFERLSDMCDTFLVGSDQTWNYNFTKALKCGTYYQLGFLQDLNKRRISYASSFGGEAEVPPSEEYAKLYQKFDAVSVREQFGVDVCKNKYNTDATFVWDPVFLLDKEDYSKLADQSEQNEKDPYIFAYFLSPTPEIRKACRMMKEKLGLPIIVVTEGDTGYNEDYRYILEHDNIRLNATVEDWLYYIKNAEYVITDSFHGTCFSLIFEKNFMAFEHLRPARFRLLHTLGDASSHIQKDFSEEFFIRCLKSPNYKAINKAIEKGRKNSLIWLENALNYTTK